MLCLSSLFWSPVFFLLDKGSSKGSVSDSLSDKFVAGKGILEGSNFFGGGGSLSKGKVPSKARAVGSKGDEVRVGSVTDSLSDKAVGEAGNAMGSKCFGDEGSPSGPSKARAAGSKGDEVEGGDDDVGVGGVPYLLSDAATKPLMGVLVPFLSSGKTVCTIQISDTK